MTVSFNDIPSDILTPGHFVEIDPTGAIEGTGARPRKTLIVGYRFSGGAASDTSGITFPTGTVGENIVSRVTRPTEAQGYHGIGSQVAMMAEAALDNDPNSPTYVMGIDDPAGTNAEGTVTFTATTPAAGVQNVYVAGTRYQVSVTAAPSASTPTSLATALETLVNADVECPVTAVAAVGVVTLTAKHPGPEGNFIDIRVNYRDTDATPLGVTAVAVAMASGATSIDLSTAIAALGGTQYDTVICGLADAANVSLWEAELADRWGPMQDIDGHLFVGFTGTHGETTTYTTAPARNSEQSTVACAGASPTAPWIAAADMGGIDAKQTNIDPARPRTTIVCKNTLAPEAGDRWSQTEANTVLQTGGASMKVNASGNMMVERITTSYQKNSQGAADPTWLDLSTKRTVSYLRWNWKTRLMLKYPRHKLADSGTPIAPGSSTVTPETIRAEAIAWFSEMQRAGLVEGADQFREDLVVERDATDRNRINDILRPDVINKFVVSATKLQFKL